MKIVCDQHKIHKKILNEKQDTEKIENRLRLTERCVKNIFIKISLWMELPINVYTDSCAAFDFIALYVPERKKLTLFSHDF